MNLSEAMLQYATETQAVYLKAYLENGGSLRATARALGKNKESVRESLQRLEAKAGQQGQFEGHGFPLPKNFHMKNLTVHVKDGKIEQAWYKPQLVNEHWEDYIESRMKDFVIPQVEPERPAESQGFYCPYLIPWINIGDAHFGLLADKGYTGEDFNLDLALEQLTTGVRVAIEESRPVQRMVLNDLGDFTHYENDAGVTNRSGNMLDTDGTYSDMVEMATLFWIWAIRKALTKAWYVDVIINQGNHSRINDWWMRHFLSTVFEKEPRVRVLDNRRVFIGYRMGNTLVMTHHRDKCPPDRQIDVMLKDYRKEFGETQFHYIFNGHVHHKSVSKERGSIIIESFNNLAPNDRHHHDEGYRSRQCVTRVDLDKRFGEVGRRVVPIQEVEAVLGLETGWVSNVVEG